MISSYYFFEEQIKFKFLNFYCLYSEFVSQSVSQSVSQLGKLSGHVHSKMLVLATKIKIFTRRGPCVVFSGYYFNFYHCIFYFSSISKHCSLHTLVHTKLLFTSQSQTFSMSCRISTYCPVGHLFFVYKTVLIFSTRSPHYRNHQNFIPFIK